MSISLQSLMPSAGGDTARTPLTDLLAFIAVGGSGALAYVGLSSLMIGTPTGLPDWLVSALSYAFLILPVYLLHRRFSFRSNARHEVALPRYVLVQLSALSLVAGFSYLCYSVFGMQSMIAGFVITGLTAGVNFVVLKLWAFAQA